MAYEELEPFATHRADVHAASICATVMNAMAMAVGSKNRFEVKDYLLQFGEQEKKATKTHTKEAAPAWQQHKLIAQMFVALSKAEEKAGKRKRKR